MDLRIPVPAPCRERVVDRIDLVQASAGIEVLDSGIAGPPGTRDVTYDALLITARNRVLSRSTFWVVDRGARPRLRVTTGDHIRVAWRNAPGYRRDWIGIHRQRNTDLSNDYLTFEYTGATVAGSTTIADRLPPGRYVVRLMKDDGYAELARAAFRVRR